MASDAAVVNHAWRPSSRSDVAARLDAVVGFRHPKIVATEARTIARIASDILPDLASATDPEGQLPLALCKWIIGRLDHLEGLRRIRQRGEAQVATADDGPARRLAILDFARALGASGRDLRRDGRAFRRWFELDAVSDRAQRAIGLTEFEMTIGLGRLAACASTRGPLPRVAMNALRQMTERLLSERLDDRTVAAALECLERCAALSEKGRVALNSGFAYQVSRLALDRRSSPLVAEAALSCLCVLAPDSGARALIRVLERPSQDGGFWIQRACIKLATSKVADCDAVAQVIARAMASDSAAVRQAVAFYRQTPLPAQDSAIRTLAAADPDLAVRLSALQRLPELVANAAPETATDPGTDTADDAALSLMRDRLAAETDPAALRLLFELLEGMAWRMARAGQDADLAALTTRILPLLSRHVAEAESEAITRYAAAAREGIWCAATPEAFALHEGLADFIASMSEGSAKRLTRALGRAMQDRALAGRVLAVLARRDFGLSLERGGLGGLRLRRGERFGIRLWRVLHEYRNPSTDKRQAFRHTIGRVNAGRLQAPSGVLAELSQTKVPGEPVFIEAVQGWRNYLPLLDLVIAAAQERTPVEIYSPEGVTTVATPRSRFARWRTRMRLHREFARIAELRNGQNSASYLAALSQLGIDVRLTPHVKAAGVSGVQRHVPVVILPIFPELTERWQTYIYSIYQNTLGQLAVFMALALAWFLGRHYILSRRIRRVRRALPLVIGGWGTRGKSGTERLKAGMFNGLGIPLISKTTGCEAMFLHSEAFGDTKELFLFRPFDKATIWEQARVARMGRDCGSGVVLWECMGLTPSYVAILQRQWMRDDLSTITNTYPDHEDLQGPAGRNIPEVMTEFIPDRSTVLTTEEQMLPILQEGARCRNSRLIGVDWCAPLVLPHEALARFPYDEHPANIALVLRLAHELGLDHDRALREMAEKVVPDLGVLKTYPVAKVGRRRLEFVNGMSANERFGAMGNWRRTGFAAHDPYADPGQFLVTVVNNRADRVPRSRVFAQILVDDFIADAHLLIGSNLQGMEGYIDEALTKRLAGFTLRDDAGAFLSAEAAAARIVEEIRRLRVPYAPEHLAGIAGALLGSDATTVDPSAEAVAKAIADAGASDEEAGFAKSHMALRRAQLGEAQELLTAARNGKIGPPLEEDCRTTFARWFRTRIHVEPDTHASGDEVVERLVGLTPPGLMSRVMGIQNIKGTGLGFIYKWQDYEQQAKAVLGMATGAEDQIDQALRKLESGPLIGQLGRDCVLAALDELEVDSAFKSPSIKQRMKTLRQTIIARDTDFQTREAGQGSAGILAAVLGVVEGLVDAFFAIKRRNTADRVYADLVHQRIGRDRAAQEIQSLNAAQKGGWLFKKVTQRYAATKRKIAV